MSQPDLVAVATIVVLLALAAVLAAIETVLQRLPLVRALRLVEEQRPGAPQLLWVLEHRATSLNVVLLCTVTARVVVAALLVVLLDEAFASLGIVAAVLLAIALSLFAGEIAPRTFTLRHLEAVGLRLGPPASVLVRVLEPVARLVVRAGRAVVPARGPVSGPYAGDDEVHDDADIEETDDELDDDERAMIHSILELRDTVVREIMVPRPDVVSVSHDATCEQLTEVVVRHGYSRLPVHGERPDDIVGIVYAKDLLRHVAIADDGDGRPDGPGRWQDLIRRPTYVPETKNVDELLRALQEQVVHLALVVDEYGDLVGLVTIEDILEEIVGEIVDEHDQEEPLVELLDDEQVRVDARLSVDALNELLDAELPTEGWDSVGGLVFGTLGRVPAPGEALDVGGLTLTTERVQGRRVSKVLVHRRARGPEAAPDDAATVDAHRGPA